MPKETTPSVAEQADERAAFEATIGKDRILARCGDAYVSEYVENDWYVWQEARATLAASQAASHSAPEPVGWVSPEQLAAHPDGGSDASGRYLPVRKTPAGKFTMPIYGAARSCEDGCNGCENCTDYAGAETVAPEQQGVVSHLMEMAARVGDAHENHGRNADETIAARVKFHAAICAAVAPLAPLGAESKACASVWVEPTETETLRARIAELEAGLLPYKEAETAAFLLAQRRDRAEAIADALFPRYDSVYARRHPEEKPPQWHEKSWWWNGVSVGWDDSDIEPTAPAMASLSLTSYVGGGETETVHIQFPAKWLEGDDWHEPLAAFVAEKVGERSARKAASDAAEAQRQIEQAKATLRRLTGEQS